MTSLARYAAQLRERVDEFLDTPDSRRNSFRFALSIAEMARLMEREARLAEEQP